MIYTYTNGFRTGVDVNHPEVKPRWDEGGGRRQQFPLVVPRLFRGLGIGISSTGVSDSLLTAPSGVDESGETGKGKAGEEHDRRPPSP